MKGDKKTTLKQSIKNTVATHTKKKYLFSIISFMHCSMIFFYCYWAYEQFFYANIYTIKTLFCADIYYSTICQSGTLLLVFYVQKICWLLIMPYFYLFSLYIYIYLFLVDNHLRLCNYDFFYLPLHIFFFIEHSMVSNSEL